MGWDRSYRIRRTDGSNTGSYRSASLSIRPRPSGVRTGRRPTTQGCFCRQPATAAAAYSNWQAAQVADADAAAAAAATDRPKFVSQVD